ncbi:MAG: AAA family ATPase [Bacilli bacterium]|jgi:ATP-dependent Clp protease ATP-binding subunit ClpC
MFSKFTEEAQQILINAKKEMYNLKHPYVGSEHLLLAILKEENEVSKKLKRFNINYKSFKEDLVKIMGIGSIKKQWFLYTPLLKRVIESAILDSKDDNDEEVSVHHLFCALLEEGEGVAIRILLNMGIDMDKIYELFAHDISNRKIKSKKLLIEEMGIDLTEKAVKGELDPVIGREKEVQRVIEIISRRTKNNPLLVGEAGVGKTAIVEYLSYLIVKGEVPLNLKNKRILGLDMATLVAGTKYRGEFEERMKRMIKELEDNNDIIMFLDEVHTLVGVGGAEGAIDAANILKPALARNKIKCIGATTTDEYKRNIEKDRALDRRFQKVFIEAPNKTVVKDILLKLKGIYESYHQVSINNNIIDLIITLSEKYIYDRNQPDKSIDILDEVCAKASLKESKSNNKINDLYQQLDNIKRKKNECIINHEFSEAYKYKEEEEKLLDELNNLELKIINKEKIKKVTKENVAEVINNRTKIPVYEILNDNKSFFNKLMKDLKERIIGQEEAINNLINITKRIKLGFKGENKCYSYLFCGPTGVGKTELALIYAKNLVGENNVIKLDMSEYSESHTLSKIIGAPPGYVGYEDQQNILEEIRNKPNSVLILDEIDRAHSSVRNLFLQVLDQAELKDSNGRVVHFDNVLIIMTTNIGFNKGVVGFNNVIDKKVNSKLKQELGVEFINRIYNVIIFNRLGQEEIEKIINNQLIKVKERFEKQKVKINKLVVTEIMSLIDYHDFGARKIEKVIQDKVESNIIDKIMDGKNEIGIKSIKECV